MLRLEKLSVQLLQPPPLLHGLAPRLVALAQTAGASDEHLLGATQALLQLQHGGASVVARAVGA